MHEQTGAVYWDVNLIVVKLIVNEPENSDVFRVYPASFVKDTTLRNYLQEICTNGRERRSDDD